MLIQIHPENPQERLINQVVECLKNGGIIIYPTDSLYGIGCDIHNAKAVERVCKLKGIKPNKHNFSFVFKDLSQISDYTRPFNNSVFKALKKNFPGPYTFILEANNNVPKLLYTSKKTVGIRVPNHPICQLIIEKLGSPLLSTSVKSLDEDDVAIYLTDPEEIESQFGKLVDYVIDAGASGNIPSTVIDATSGDLILIREGLGEFS